MTTAPVLVAASAMQAAPESPPLGKIGNDPDGAECQFADPGRADQQRGQGQIVAKEAQLFADKRAAEQEPTAALGQSEHQQSAKKAAQGEGQRQSGGEDSELARIGECARSWPVASEQNCLCKYRQHAEPDAEQQ